MSLKLYIIAGEASGDQLGAGLIQSLKAKHPNIEIRGIGGDAMMKVGMDKSLFPMEQLSVMGIAEILPRIPKFINLIAQAVQAICVFDPDIVVTVDAPDFSFRVQKKIKALGVRAKKIHYVAPTVWAWRASRAQKVASFLDGMMCLFPFEPAYFEREGLKSIAVGHPMTASGLLAGDGHRFRQQHKIGPEQKVFGLFCGSRTSEVQGLAPIMVEVATNIAKTHPDMVCIIPTLPKWHHYLENLFRNAGLNAIVTSDVTEKWDAFRAPDAALVVSGTVALEVALAGIPHVILYKMNWLTWQIISRVIKTKFAHLGNVLLGKLIYPEFIQDDATVEKITPAVNQLFINDLTRKEQMAASAKIIHLLEAHPNKKAADSAAAFVMSFISKN
jgi:lipid-A-disaccharide synthase